MSLVVQKYGGTSVRDVSRIKAVAELVEKSVKENDTIIVVVSAMAGQTDNLVNMANELCDEPDEREMDRLLSTGELVTIPLLTMALHSLGLKAISLTGRQSGIITDDMHTKARIKYIEKKNIERWIHKGYVVVVAGFQGVRLSEDGHVSDITTLGRGGTDTTAMAIAVALKADRCEIYTDVDGVYTTDPRIEPQATRIDRISYEEMLEMASMGAKVLQIRSVEFAAKYKMPILVKSSYTNGPGTWVVEEESSMEEVAVSSVVFNRDQAKVTIIGVPDRPGIAAKIFKAVAENEINVDMIIQNVSAEELTDLSLTVPNTEAKKALKSLKDAVKEIGAKDVLLDEDVAKVSIIGVGMRSHTGVAAKMFSILAGANINILMISTSEIKVSCVIKKGDVDKAVKVLHKGFELDRAGQE